MKMRKFLMFLSALCGSLSALSAQSSTVESNVFSLDTRLLFESNVFSLDSRTYLVTFSAGGYASRSGGGALEQTILHAHPATAPTLTVTDGWVFDRWSEDFSVVIRHLSVDAVIRPNTTDADQDGLNYYEEVIVYGSDPHNADSSGDCFSDGAIASAGFDPNADYSAIAQLAADALQHRRVGAAIAGTGVRRPCRLCWRKARICAPGAAVKRLAC